MEREATNQPNKEHFSTTNVDLEVSLVKIARVLFEYVDSQEQPHEINRVNLIFKDFDRLVADYHNQTERLHPDLCYDLGEWATLKAEVLAMTKEELSLPDQRGLPAMVQTYHDSVHKIIEELEQELGIVQA
ncbi:MAG: hypothetical protein ACREX3_00065 [Gammaproteobacteria bacterium]